MLLSIIIPVYNVSNYLDECLKNLLIGHSSNLEYEIILVDDGSTDNSGLKCDFYSKHYQNIITIHKENNGLSSARNEGLRCAHGNWIAFIDSDDMVCKNYIGQIINLIKLTKADLIMFNYKKFEAVDELKSINSKEQFKEINIEDAMYDITCEKWGSYAWNKIYTKKLFNGIDYPIKKNYEDIFTTYKLLYRAKKIVLSSSILYYYRQRAGSIQHSNSIQAVLDCEQARLDQLDFFKNKQFLRASNQAEYELSNFYVELIKFMVRNKKKNNPSYKRAKEYLKNYLPYANNNRLKVKIILITYLPSFFDFICKLRK